MESVQTIYKNGIFVFTETGKRKLLNCFEHAVISLDFETLCEVRLMLCHIKNEPENAELFSPGVFALLSQAAKSAAVSGALWYYPGIPLSPV